MNQSTITRITVGRLYNLGSYEHIRYELQVEVPEGQSAGTAIVAVEKLLSALAPERNWSVETESEILRNDERVLELKDHLLKLTVDEFRHKHGFFEGTPKEYVERCAKQHDESILKRAIAVRRSKKARKLFDDLGGAANWKDAKLDWEDDFGDQF